VPPLAAHAPPEQAPKHRRRRRSRPTACYATVPMLTLHGVSPAPAQIWQGPARPQCRSRHERGEPL
jgi:hypothetical protein